MTFRIGATLLKDEIPYWEPKLTLNNWMRIFPDSDGLPPDYDDPRFVYCQRVGAIPFISTKIDGDNAKLDTLKAWFEGMPAWMTLVYHTDRHEPEGDLSAATFIANFNECLAKIDTLAGPIRARVKTGPVLTRQYTENTSGRTYLTHDPGTGDFFGVDMYGNSWSSSDASAATTNFVAPVTFLSKVKAYKYDVSDDRPRIFPELGYIGAPFDTDTVARAVWFEGIITELLTWNSTNPDWTMPWDHEGVIWWNVIGKSGSSLTGIGTKRYFQFDRRHTGTDGSYVIVSNAPLTAKYNQLVVAVTSDTPIDPDPDFPDDDPDTPTDPDEPDPGETDGEPEPVDPEVDPDPDPDPESEVESPSTSVSITATLALSGVWIHDPANAELSSEVYLYGTAAKSTAIDVASSAMTFAGRTYPVFQYSDQQSETYSVHIDVPHGEDWASKLRSIEDTATSRSTVMFRDNRGRKAYGVITGLRESDQIWGTGLDFTFTRVEYDEGYTVVV